MHLPGPIPLLFLCYLLVLMPVVAIRSARFMQAARAGTTVRPLPSRASIWARTTAALVALLAFAWYTGRGFDYRPFAVPPLGAADLLASVATLAIAFGLRAVSRAVRTEAERRDMAVYVLAPRNGREWLLWTLTVLVASVAEETAYRGVGMAILWWALGSPWTSAGICAVGFALAHWTQGGKSAVIIVLMALAMHGLVAVTGTLVLAMVVHAVYDLVAGYQIAGEARRFDAEAAAA
jgi:membrane protease YdiL (CAAX protease family)